MTAARAVGLTSREGVVSAGGADARVSIGDSILLQQIGRVRPFLGDRCPLLSPSRVKITVHLYDTGYLPVVYAATTLEWYQSALGCRPGVVAAYCIQIMISNLAGGDEAHSRAGTVSGVISDA